MEKVIYDRNSNEFSEEDTDFFWFSIFRKIYMRSQDPGVDKDCQDNYKSLGSYLEDHLHAGTEQQGKIARTAFLFLIIGQGDKAGVEKIIHDYPNLCDFKTHMRTIPGQIFHPDMCREYNIQVSPLTLALKKRDVDLLHLLHNSVWGEVKLFSSNVVMKMKVALCLDILRKDLTFFEKLDISN